MRLTRIPQLNVALIVLITRCRNEQVIIKGEPSLFAVLIANREAEEEEAPKRKKKAAAKKLEAPADEAPAKEAKAEEPATDVAETVASEPANAQ